jgi:hypothetical protein
VPEYINPVRVLLLFALSVLGGCALLAPRGQLPPLPLLPPAGLEQSLQISQRVNISFGEDSRTFLGAWAVNPQSLSLVGLTPSGQSLMTLSYDGHELVESYSPVLTEAIPGREVLSQLQLAHWPQASIDQALADTPWRLHSEGLRRHLYYRDNLILSIDASYTAGDNNILPAAIRITSHVAPYRLEVQTLQVVTQ